MYSGTRAYSEIDGIKTINILEQNTEKGEAVAVGKIIEQRIGGFGFHSMDFGRVDYTEKSAHRSFSDFAILYRTGGQCKVFEDVFDKEGIPYQVVSRESVFNQKNIAELVSLLKVIDGVASFADLGRIADLKNPGISGRTLDILKNWSYKNGFTVKEALVNARRFPVPGMSKTLRLRLYDFAGTLLDLEKETGGMPVFKKIVRLVEKTKLSTIIKDNPKTEDAFKRVVEMARGFGENSSEYFLMHALRADTDVYTPEAEKVSLMTMHTAKGLEFPVVFITGCEKDLIPFKSIKDPHPDIDEERRLFYVAMTRAKHELFLTYAKKRRIYGKQTAREISPFVLDIEKRLRKQETPNRKSKKKGVRNQLSLF
jgi:DNA helicase-2/ATP-dependent DNA helicase PcrA